MAIRRRTAAVLLAFGIGVCGLQARAYTPYDSYTYSNATGQIEAIATPAPYTPVAYIDQKTVGTSLSRPCDFCFGPDGNLYLVDSVLNKVVVLDTNFDCVREIDHFEQNGASVAFNAPKGIFVDKTGNLYICDTENSRVVLLDSKGNLKTVYAKPNSPLLGKKYTFKPLKITVDDSGTMYLINSNENSGLMKITPNGEFVGFVGSNKAVVSPVVKFWKKIMSETQKQQLLTFVPVEYQNISMDADGFIYAVSAAKAEKTPIRRLNLSGTDILIHNGYVDVSGDLLQSKDSTTGETTGNSVFTDICAASNGNYYALDSSHGRIFVYNREGYLLYVFGGTGTQIGTFVTPSAIELSGDQVYVLDEVSAAITVFEKTAFATAISQAESDYYSGKFEQSMTGWEQVLKYDSTYELAYLQQGKIYLQQKEYENAMRCFRLGNYRGDKITYMTGYNKAYTESRKLWVSQYLGIMVLGGLALVLITVGLRRRKAAHRQHRSKGAQG